MRFFKLDTLGDTDDPELCVLGSFVKGIEMDAWRVGEGERLGAIFPKDAKIYMDKENLGIQLSDLLGNTRNMLVVSKAFKEVLERHCGSKVEYLPFTLYDHRKRVYSRDYFIINPLGTFDCLDFEASTIRWGKAKRDRVAEVLVHVLDPKKVSDAPQLFRVDKDPTAYVVGEKLAREISDRDFSNVFWTELDVSKGG